MELQHIHCVTCLSQKCMTRPEPGISCDLVTCPLVCGAIFHTCKGPEHRLLCPLERVPCLNSGFGCPVTMVRTRIPAHLEVCPAGVVCCTMEWNRWPISCLDYTSYESLSWGVEETEQLDMALALQDQHTLIESLKVVAMAPTVERQPTVVAVESETVAAISESSSVSLTTQSSPPLTLQSSPPLTLQSSPPLTLQSSPPFTLQSSPPLTLQSSPPLTTQSSPPLTTQSSPPLTTQSSPPLTTQSSPPLTTQSPPPLTLQSPPPLTLQSSPPLTLQSSPPLPAQSSPPLPAQSSPPLPAQSSPPLPAQSSPPLPAQSSPPLPAQSSPPLPAQSSPPLPAQSSPPLTLQSSPPLTLQSSPPLPAQSSPPLTLQSSPPLTLQSSPPLTLQSSPPLTAQSSPPLTTQSSPPLTLQSSPPLTLQSSPPLPAQSSPPLPAQSSPPLPAQSSPPLTLQSSPPLPAQSSPPLMLQSSPPLPTQSPPPLTLQSSPPLPTQSSPPLPAQSSPPLTLQSSPPLPTQSSPPLPTQSPLLVSAKDKIANGIKGLNEERYSKLYEATVETARSLAAALDVLSSANSSDNNTEQDININRGAVLEPQLRENSSDRNEELLLHNRLEVKGPVAEGVDLKECYGQLHQLHQATVQLRRSLVTALGDLGNTVKYTDPINGAPYYPQAEPNGSSHQLEDAEAGSTVRPLRVVSRTYSEVAMNVIADGNMQRELFCGASKSVEGMDGQSLCNGCLSGSQKRPGEQVLGSDSADQQQPGASWSSSEAVCPVKVQDDLNLSPVPQGSCGSQSQPQPQSHPDPPLAPPLHITQGIAHRASHVVLEDRGLERKFQNHQLHRGLGQFALSNGRRVRVRFRPKMEDKAVDTSDLEQEDDPMGLGEIDLITAALLFCLEESRKCRRISETTYVDGFHVDFGTQTFTFPAAILVTSTRVGDVASAAACDHTPQLSYPSPFRTLRLDLVLEEVPQIRNMPCNRLQQMFSFICGQLFRRDEYSSHFKNVHEDIHAGLNGWMEHRCPLAYYGCTYSQRRFCPSSQGSKVIHDRNLRSFGVQPSPVGGGPLGESQSDQFSGLPFEVLQHVARFLDGFSLCQLSMVSRTMRDLCASLLQSRGIVELRWERRQFPNGTFSWQIKDRVWRFSTAFSPVSEWRFSEVSSMSDHLRKCRYNTVERKLEAVPLPSMCTARDRSLLSVLKLQEQHMT